eukprot:gene6756-9258_t
MQRNVYLQLDMNWIEDIVKPHSKVKVNYVPAASIKNIVVEHINTNLNDGIINTAFDKYNEVYQIYYSNIPNSFNVDDIDTFFVHNPCFIPLHEPIQNLNNKLRSFKDYNHKSKFGNNTNSEYYQALSHVLIFIKLPQYGFHSTCRFYKLITALQFPSKCDSKQKLVHQLTNIGWSNVFFSVFGKYSQIFDPKYFPKAVFVMPTAQSFLAQELDQVKDINSGKLFKKTDVWKWIDMKTCSPYKIAYDPWACNFISISNCTSHETGVSLLDKNAYPAELPLANFASTQILKPILNERKFFDDSPLLSDEQWAFSRFSSFLQRPNYNLRSLLRESFHSIEHILPVNRQSFNSNKDSFFSHKRILPSYVPKPCLALHVRHGDAMQEHRTSDYPKIIRSLQGHMAYAINLTHALGIKIIFIASDNATVISNAPFEYPEYSWYTQKRTIKDLSQKFYEVRNEDSIQKDLAKVIADLRIGSSCQGIVGSTDSALSEFMFIQACALSREGRCPPSVDMREAYHGEKFLPNKITYRF